MVCDNLYLHLNTGFLLVWKHSKNHNNNSPKGEEKPKGTFHAGGFFLFVLFCKQTLKVSFPLVDWANRTGNIRELAAWLILKRQYRTGHIHSIKSCKAFKRKTASKYLNRLLDLGLIVPDPNFGYQCISLKKAALLIGFKNNFRVFELNNTSINDIVNQLRALIIRSKVRQQRKIVKDKSPAKRITKNNPGLTPITLSDYRAGHYIRHSTATGRRLKQWMQNNGLITLTNQLPKFVCMASLQTFRRMMDAAMDLVVRPVYIWRQGAVWVTQAQQIELSPLSSPLRQHHYLPIHR